MDKDVKYNLFSKKVKKFSVLEILSFCPKYLFYNKISNIHNKKIFNIWHEVFRRQDKIPNQALTKISSFLII